jgi:hypothetical protein
MDGAHTPGESRGAAGTPKQALRRRRHRRRHVSRHEQRAWRPPVCSAGREDQHGCGRLDRYLRESGFVGAHRLCVLVCADPKQPGACLLGMPAHVHCHLLRLRVEVAPPSLRCVQPSYDTMSAPADANITGKTYRPLERRAV